MVQTGAELINIVVTDDGEDGILKTILAKLTKVEELQMSLKDDLDAALATHQAQFDQITTETQAAFARLEAKVAQLGVAQDLSVEIAQIKAMNDKMAALLPTVQAEGQ